MVGVFSCTIALIMVAGPTFQIVHSCSLDDESEFIFVYSATIISTTINGVD